MRAKWVSEHRRPLTVVALVSLMLAGVTWYLRECDATWPDAARRVWWSGSMQTLRLCFVRRGTPEGMLRQRLGPPLAVITCQSELERHLMPLRRQGKGVPDRRVTAKVLYYEDLAVRSGMFPDLLMCFYYVDERGRVEYSFIAKD